MTSSAIRQIARLGATGAIFDEASNNMVERTGLKRPAAHHDSWADGEQCRRLPGRLLSECGRLRDGVRPRRGDRC